MDTPTRAIELNVNLQHCSIHTHRHYISRGLILRVQLRQPSSFFFFFSWTSFYHPWRPFSCFVFCAWPLLCVFVKASISIWFQIRYFFPSLEFCLQILSPYMLASKKWPARLTHAYVLNPVECLILLILPSMILWTTFSHQWSWHIRLWTWWFCLYIYTIRKSFKWKKKLKIFCSSLVE